MKSRRSFLISMALIASILFSNTAVFAKTAQREIDDNLACTHEECGSQVYYKIEDKVLTIYGEGAMCDFAIYRFMDQFESPWYWDDFDHIVIEPGITHIGAYAFAFCNPDSVTIPDTVTSIGKEAFYDCQLTQVNYNGTMAQWQRIDDNSCDGNLTQNPVNCTDGVYTCVVDGGEWTLSEGTLTFLENPADGWFDPCLEDWPFSEIPWFTYRNFIDEVVIADGVTYICGGAFIWLDVERIIIPESVTGFGYYSFYSYRADKIYYTGTEDQWNRIRMDDCGFEYDVTPVYSCPHSEVNGSCIVCGKILQTNPCDTLGHSFTSYTNNGNGTITATCDRCDATTTVRGGNIDTKAWWKLENNTLTIFGTGEMLDYYGYETVPPWSGSGCTQVVIEPGITSICRYAFDSQEEIESITIPATVTWIGDYAFGGCTGVQEITYGGTIAQWKAVSMVKDDGVLTQNPIQCTDGTYDPAAITGTCGENLTWTLSGKTLTISGTGPMENFWYDSCFEDEPYVDSPWQQYSSQVTKLVIEEGVTSISDAAFYQFTEIRELTIPDSVTGIGIYAFRECGLTDVTIGDGMKFLQAKAFDGCGNLSRLTLGKNIKDVDMSLFEIGATLDIYLTGPMPVVTTSEYSFEGKMGNYTLYMTVEDLREMCRRDFTEYFDMPGNLAGWADAISLDGQIMTRLVIPEGVTAIGRCVFANWESLTDVSISSDVTTIGSGAFYGCKNLTSVEIAEGVKEIGYEAFMGCSALARVTLPASLIRIGDDAFRNCTAIKDVYYGGNQADWDNITVESGNTDLLEATIHFTGHEHVFTFYLSNNDATCTQDGTKTAKCDHCNVLDTKVDVGSALGHSFTNYISNGNGTKTATCDRCDATDTLPDDGPKFGACGENLQWVLGADGILKISGTGAMTDFTYDFDTGATDIPWYLFRLSVTGIEIAPGVTTIGKYAFRDCVNVTEITIPSGVTAIGNSAFWLCTGLKTVQIPETVTAIGGYAFYKCSALTSATVPDGITAINNSVFYQCSAMTQVTLPATVTSIGDSAFRGCSALEDVYFGGTQTQWNTIALGGNNNPLVSATVHCSDVEENKPEGWVEENGAWYFYQSGELQKSRWLLDGGKWYWLGADGKMAVNCWRQDSKGWVYLGQDGAMLVNAWCTDSQGWCYVGADGYAVTNCWKKDSKGWIWLNSQGSMTKNTWIKDGGKWYFLDANGYMVSNQWRKDSKGWCWLTASGAMATNQWVKDSKGWCYVGADGYCWTNRWAKDSIGWIWLDKEGSMTKSKWIYTGGSWYYLDDQGYMLTNTTWNGYHFNASGVCTNP